MQGNRSDQNNRESHFVDDKSVDCSLIGFNEPSQSGETNRNTSENSDNQLINNTSDTICRDNNQSMGKRCFDWSTMAVASISPTLSGPVLTSSTSLIDSSLIIGYNESPTSPITNQQQQSNYNYPSPYNGLSSYWFYQGAFNNPIKGKDQIKSNQILTCFSSI